MADTGLKGKVALITGANHGIGAATAVAFGREGADVFLTYKRLSPEKKEASGPRAVPSAEEPGPDCYDRILGRDAETVIASAVVFFASRQADWITGQVLYVGGGNRM